MPTDSEIAVVNQYLARLEKAFGHVPSAERDELVEEVRSHVLERIEAAPHVTEQVVNEILRAVGDPRELAAQHKTEVMLRQAVASRSPWTLLRSTLRWARTGIVGVISLLVTMTGYGCAAVCYLSVFLKPLFPARIGLWLRPEHMLTLGYWDGRFSGTEVYGISVRPPVSFVLGTLGPTQGPVRELLGPWLFPVGVVCGGLFVVITTLLTRWLIRRFGLQRWSRSRPLEPTTDPVAVSRFPARF
ncbi:MAG TPA: hypothetical protein VFE68_07245 [Vicinamibacteria bacterium]|nr:hypothetical protein [Vicinamibacteria bacterium]